MTIYPYPGCPSQPANMADMPKTSEPETTVSVNVALPASLHKRLRVYCIQNDLVLAEVIAAALERFV